MHYAPPRTTLLLLVSLAGLGTRCLEDPLMGTQGTLKVTVTHAPQNTPTIEITAHTGEQTVRQSGDTARPETVIEVKDLDANNWDVRVAALDATRVPLNAVWISDVLIHGDATTEVRVDLANGVTVPHGLCDNANGGSAPVCTVCQDGFEVALADDARCGAVSCAGLDVFELRGDNTAAGSATCVHVEHPNLIDNRCKDRGACWPPDSTTRCTAVDTTVATAGTCQEMAGCVEGHPTVSTSADGTPCGGGKVCEQGVCVTPQTCVPANTAVCHQCVNNVEAAMEDDARCGSLACTALDRFEVRGDNTAAGTATCVHTAYPPITSHRCDAASHCRTPDATTCVNPVETTAATAGLCHTLSGCETGSPVVNTSPDHTACGGGNVCISGSCVPPAPEVGCADGSREGFLSQTSYPAIAACSGAWSVAGITRTGLAATCNRTAGNQGSNREGSGCAAADLCAAGWHVCNGRTEVGAKAPAGCADAVPAGTPDKALFFAVAQHSTSNSACDDTTNDNDVFGCGNLGVVLAADRNCAPLTRVLASTQPNSCGYNEAEPNLGPWQCLGGTGSDLHEGANVTKKGCPATSCSYSGSPVGNTDKGGVLCCRD